MNFAVCVTRSITYSSSFEAYFDKMNDYQDVKCRFCGFFSSREESSGRLLEVTRSLRVSMDFQKSFPDCYKGKRDFMRDVYFFLQDLKEARDAGAAATEAGRKAVEAVEEAKRFPWNREELPAVWWAIIDAPYSCNVFTKYVPELSPREHSEAIDRRIRGREPPSEGDRAKDSSRDGPFNTPSSLYTGSFSRRRGSRHRRRCSRRSLGQRRASHRFPTDDCS